MEDFSVSFSKNAEGVDHEFRKQLLQMTTTADMNDEYCDTIAYGVVSIRCLQWVKTTAGMTLGEVVMDSLKMHSLSKIDSVRSTVAMHKILESRNPKECNRVLDQLLNQSPWAFRAVLFSINNVLFDEAGFTGLMELLDEIVSSGQRSEGWYKVMCDAAKWMYEYNELFGCGQVLIWKDKEVKQAMKRNKLTKVKVVKL